MRLHGVGRDFAYYYYYYYYIVINFMHCIYDYILETNNVSRVHNVAADVYLPLVLRNVYY